MFFRQEHRVDTKKEEFKEVNRLVRETVKESGVENGFCLVFCPHTTAGITVNERESGLKKDFLNYFKKIAPREQGYEHDKGPETNAHAHIRSVLTGNNTVIPVENSELVLGTWQNIFLVEGDGPRKRSIKVYVYGE